MEENYKQAFSLLADHISNFAKETEDILQKCRLLLEEDSVEIMSDEQLKRTLQTIGRSVFVDYYEVFRDKDNKIAARMLSAARPDLETCSGRVSEAKRIFRTHSEKRALEQIANSTRVEDRVLKKCRQLLDFMK